MRVFNEENSKSADKIKCLAQVNNTLLTEDDGAEDKEGEQPKKESSDSESEVKKRHIQPPPSVRRTWT